MSIGSNKVCSIFYDARSREIWSVVEKEEKVLGKGVPNATAKPTARTWPESLSPQSDVSLVEEV